MLERCPNADRDRLRDEVADFTVAQDGKSEVIKDRRMVGAACGTVSHQGDQIAEHELCRRGGDPADGRAPVGRGPSPHTVQVQAQANRYGADPFHGPQDMDTLGTRQDPAEQAGRQAIRALADDPSLAHRMMLQAGVSNPEAELTFRQMEDEARRLAKARLRAELGDVIAGANADKIFERMFDAVTEARRDAAGHAGS